MKYLKKVLISIMILTVMINSHEFVYAVGAQLPGENPTQNIRNTQGENGTKANSGYGVDDLIGSTVNGIVGLITFPFKIIIIVIGSVARMITGSIAVIGGLDGDASATDTIFISPDEILFNKIPLTDINFFDFSNSNGAISSIRKNVAIPSIHIFFFHKYRIYGSITRQIAKPK